MRKDKKQAEKFYKCTNCKKDCLPAAIIKPKAEKERCYCSKCLKQLLKPTEF